MIDLKKESKLFYYLQILLDVLIIILGYYLALKIRFSSSFEIEKQFGIFFNIYPYIIIASLVFIYFYRTFDVVYKKYFELMYSVFLLLILIQLSTMAITFFSRDFGFARSIFLISFFIQFIGFAVFKYLSIKICRIIYGKKSLMIIGTENRNEKVVPKIKDEGNFELKYVLNHYDKEKLKLVDAVAVGAEIDKEIRNEVVNDAVILGKMVFIVPEFFDISIHRSKLNRFDDTLVFEIGSYYLNFEEKVFKRIVDIVISLIGLVLTSPIILIAVLSVKIQDGGPVLFKQERLTKNGKRFTLYKIRSMKVDAENETGPILTNDKDDRVTTVGKFIRTTRIDELPQLFNVLKGDMSLIGPRPEREFFVKQFQEDIPNYSLRFNVKAGITGLAQVYGKYTTNPEDKLRYDLIYIREYSIFLDMEIFVQTLKVILMKIN